jgi:Ras family
LIIIPSLPNNYSAGQERFSTITANYYRGAQGALLVYDVCRRDSFEHIQKWFERAKQLGGEDLEVVLIGNKNDLPDDQRYDRGVMLDTITFTESPLTYYIVHAPLVPFRHKIFIVIRGMNYVV